jgi:hypothetical protein
VIVVKANGRELLAIRREVNSADTTSVPLGQNSNCCEGLTVPDVDRRLFTNLHARKRRRGKDRFQATCENMKESVIIGRVRKRNRQPVLLQHDSLAEQDREYHLCASDRTSAF